MRSILILFSLLLAACAPEIQYRVLPLDRPERPVLPKIKAAELTCIDQSTYQKLYDRQRLIKDYAIVLEAIIDSTHNNEDK
jgi:hypothetical protein